MFGWSKKHEIDLVAQKIAAFQADKARMNQGWRFWPANATEEERTRAIEAYLNGNEPTWYPPQRTFHKLDRC
jgi:hypothetical protein